MGIKVKKKVCGVCGELEYIWSKGQCKRCYMMAKKSGVRRRVNVTGVTQKQRVMKDAEYAAMRAKWREIEMREGEVRCMECGKFLGVEMQPMYMAHVLSKGSYPSFRCDLRNMVPMCMDHHQMMDGQVDGKTRVDMGVYVELKEISDRLKGEYYKG